MKFKRAGRNWIREKPDAKGTVQINIILRDNKGAVKGNICKSISVAGTSVGEVHAALEKLLFG
jgi:hypothetical protein